jgi:hypothetical protein
LWGKGCWGVKIHQNRPAIVSEAEKMFHENHLHQYDYDQVLLIKYYQAMAAESMVIYSIEDLIVVYLWIININDVYI